jgi:tRNA(Ile)-lysidine synthetase-like protein
VDFKEWRFLKEREYLRVVTTMESPMDHQIISLQDLPCEVGDWYLERARYNADADQLGADAIAMRLDAIVWPLEIRPPQPTDEIQPFGMQGHKRIVRLLIEKKIEQTDKRQARVWAHGSTIYWLEGMVVSELCRAGAGDDVVLIRKKERQLKP